MSQEFIQGWNRGSPPTIKCIFRIENEILKTKWNNHGTAQRESKKIYKSEKYFHGTSLICDIAATKGVCDAGNCGICGIVCDGMNPAFVRFDFHGKGFSLAPHSFKCIEYSRPNKEGYRAMLLCKVIPGCKYNLTNDGNELPVEFDSISGILGTDLNCPEIVVYNSEAILPEYIIVYE